MIRILLIVGVVLIIVVFSGVYFLRNIWFYRDPKRATPQKQGLIVSPADGKVIYIKKVKNGKVVSEKLGEKIEISEITKERLGDRPKDGWLIGIYMSPLDVHYNYSPIAAKVEGIVHTQAKVNLPMVDFWEYVKLTYLRRGVDLFAKRFHLENERNTIFLRNDSISMIVVEIADKFVNKINCFIKEGDELGTGQKLSFIERGSQVDLFILDENIDIKVKFGEQVYGAETVLAELKK